MTTEYAYDDFGKEYAKKASLGGAMPVAIKLVIS